VTFALIALGFGLLGGVIGKLKGSSFFLWFVISAVPPFVGVLAAWLYRVEHDEPEGFCPTCGKRVKLYDALCTRCGQELSFPGHSPGTPKIAR
jgi:hypothetical protein